MKTQASDRTGRPAAGAGGAGGAGSRPRPAFTLVETALVVIIVAVLAAILIVGLRGALESGRIAGERAAVVALRNGVEAFRNDHEFLPPLVQDDHDAADDFRAGGDNRRGPVWETNGVRQPVTFLSSTAPERLRRERTYLEGRTAPVGLEPIGDDLRYSNYSLAYYLGGMLNAPDRPGDAMPIDGAAGSKFRKPGSDGTFARAGKTFEAYYDPGERGGTLGNPAADPAAAYRQIIKDRWGTPIRYYQWRSFEHKAPGQPTVVESFVPRSVGDPRENPELRDAGYAIVSLGPDIRRVTALDATDDGPPHRVGDTRAPEPAVKEGVADNIVEVGR